MCLSSTPMDEFPPPADPSAESWTVHRQDDNGNRFVMHVGLSRDEAERLVAAYDALGHKQLYWADRFDPEVSS
jgi:hypothetical protein